jgi:glucose/arabinose dehydrogenase
MYLDGPGNITGTTAVFKLGVRLRSVVQAPDGSLFISTDQRLGSSPSNPQDEIWHLVPS